jgi:His-Xaa-Ser system radical SAM maturase HxsC
MIPLQLRVHTAAHAEPLVFRLRNDTDAADISSGRDAILTSRRGDLAYYDLDGREIQVALPIDETCDNDVVMILPGRSIAHRLIRSASRHNTLLVTEQCDQLCVMCSQPPKPFHNDLFRPFFEACLLAPRDAVIGISGGEPLLHKARLFDFLFMVHLNRPDLHFHILTNAQHLEEADVDFLRQLDHSKITWGVPIYASTAEIHDRIVGKLGAYATLQKGLTVLARSGASIELRTVVLRSNLDALAALARTIAKRFGYCTVWAIMQLENIGYGRKNWQLEFVDSSNDFAAVKAGIDVALAFGVDVALYNFPLCTVPSGYRVYCCPSISDWKQKFLPECDHCTARQACCGFFEWYPEHRGFERVQRL